MNKVMMLMLLSLSYSLSFAQVFDYDNVNIEIVEAKAAADLSKDCISLLIKVMDSDSGYIFQKATILEEGKSPEYPYITNEAGEVLVITEKTDIALTLSLREAFYDTIRLVDLPIKKGNAYKLLIKMKPPIVPDPIEIYELPERNIERVSYKPVIYLYPTKPTELDIQLKVEGKLTFSYPKHKDSWKCTAYPNGDIKIGERTYPYLFWEGTLNPVDQTIQKSGFVIKSENIVSFLEEKLVHIGLNDKEMTDFITFWAPRLEQNAYNYLHFSIGEEYAKNVATLKMDIKPDSELHLHLFHAPVGPDFKVPSQELPKFERKGFTLIEWGGGPIQLENQN